MKEVFEKAIIESAKYSNFAQWFKMQAWDLGLKGEDKLDDLAMITYKYFKE